MRERWIVTASSLTSIDSDRSHSRSPMHASAPSIALNRNPISGFTMLRSRARRKSSGRTGSPVEYMILDGAGTDRSGRRR